MSTDTERTRPRRALPFVLFALTIALALGGRGIVEGTASMRRSDDLFEQGDVDGSIAQAMRAARWYVPFAPHTTRAYDRLRAIALRAELAGDVETAQLAWEAIRGAARSTRTLWTPFRDRLLEADDHLATILASKPPPGIDRDTPRELLVREHRALLAEETAARPWAIVALYAGLLAFLLGSFRVTAALDRSRAIQPARFGLASERTERALSYGALAVAGLVVFVVALMRA
jgi:hypothetical protein